jgi:2-hydroxychromene-2-carboxylate isomerase
MEWFDLFKRHVAKGDEVDLVKFSRDYDAEVCERIARRHGMTFRTDPEHETAFLRKQQSPPS